MKLPKKFSDLTLGQFMQLHELSLDDDLEKFDRNIKTLSILSGKPESYIEKLSQEDFKRYLIQTASIIIPPLDLNAKDKIKIGFKTLYPTMSLQEMKVNQLIDFYSLYKQSGNDHIKSANQLLAVMFRPSDLTYKPSNHSKISKVLLKANAEDCLAYVFFYSRLWKKCEPIIQDCFQKATELLKKEMSDMMKDKEFQDFLKHGVGNIT